MFLQLTLPGGINIEDPQKEFTDVASVISKALIYVFPLAGLILFFMLIAGGFQLLISAGNPEATKKGYQKILYAVLGFLIIFVAYWLIQIVEIIFGIKVF